MTTTLLLGGTGNTGRRVRDLLAARSLPHPTLSRPAFDWADPATWSSVEVGADSAFLTYAPDIAFPGAAEAVAEVADRLLRGGLRRLVLLTGRGEPEALRAERLVARLADEHGAGWAVVRCSFFMQNFSEGLFAGSVADGELAFIADRVREPFVDLDDVAEVVVGILTGDVPDRQVHELTGPELLTFAEAVDAIAEATGRPVTYRHLTVPDLVTGLVDQGLPHADAAGLAQLLAEVLDGHNEHLTSGVRRALGREPRRFADFARDAARGGAWPAPAATRIG